MNFGLLYVIYMLRKHSVTLGNMRMSLVNH